MEQALALFGLSLDAAGSKAAGQVLLNGHEQDNNRNNSHNRGGKQVLPLDDVEAVEDVDTYSQRLEGIGGHEAESHGVFIPCVDENENQSGDDAGGSHRQQNTDHCLNTVAAVNGGGLLHLGGDGHECASQQPYCKCLVEGCVNEDKTQQSIGKMQELDDLVDTDNENHGSEHLGDDDEAQESGLTLELHTGKGISCGDAADHGDNGGAACNNDRVKQVLCHGCLDPDIHKVCPDGNSRQKSAVGIEDLAAGLKCGNGHNEVGIENNQADNSHGEVKENAGAKLFPVDSQIIAHNYSSPFFRVEIM